MGSAGKPYSEKRGFSVVDIRRVFRTCRKYPMRPRAASAFNEIASVFSS